MSVIPALGRLRQEDHEFKASLDYIVSSTWAIQRDLVVEKKRRKKIYI
jgi:hypothetical protein